YLFILCMEKLAILIQENVNDGSREPVKISRNGPAICHLVFANDCLLFVKATCSQVRIVKEVLHQFCRVS
ncbi:hypothetical protein glysoja_047994, partial [Glycine soja]